MNYKQYIQDILQNKYSIQFIVESNAEIGNIFRIKSENDHKYDIIFNGNEHAVVTIPKVSEDEITWSPFFYLDDDNVWMNLNHVICLALLDRIDFFKAEESYKFIHSKYMKMDISYIMKNVVNILPYSYNNGVKIRNRVKVLKTYTIKDDKKVYHKCFGDSAWDKNIPNTPEDIRKYSSMLNLNPISVVAPSDGVYAISDIEKYKAVGYSQNSESFTSCFPVASNIPERYRIHYTSEYLEPENPEIDYLAGDMSFEKKNALIVFVPCQSEFDNMITDSPLGDYTLGTGEILINKQLANESYYIRRTFQTDSLDSFIVDIGTIVNNGDILAWDMEGMPEITYDLKYDNAVVEDIIRGNSSYKIILKIKSKLGVARVISDYGIKGVTHPREHLGSVEIDGIGYAVQMIIGPEGTKAGSNSIKLSVLALKNMFLNSPMSDLNIENYSEDDIELLIGDMKKIPWTYWGKTMMVYAGLVSFGVTDLARDCKSDSVKIMPETLKYMFLSDSKEMNLVAEKLISDYTDDKVKWIAKELLKLRTKSMLENDSVPVLEHTDPKLKKYLDNSYFSISGYSTKKLQSNMLLNTLNKGFYLKIENALIRMPSSKLIKAMMSNVNGMIQYPTFFESALFVMLSIKQYLNKKTNMERVLKNVERYIANVEYEIFSKKGWLSLAVIPELPGGNLKQTTSTYVPKGITVILDPYLEAKVKNFKSTYKKKVYEIGVRNPVLWRFQLQVREVWTFSKFEKYLENKSIDINHVILKETITGSVLRNSIDCMYDKADTDGDLFPVAIPLDEEIQDLLHAAKPVVNHIHDYEKEWIEIYLRKTFDNKKFLDMENKKFQYHTISKEDFANKFADASIAKQDVGKGTVDLWKMHSALEYAYLNGDINKCELNYMQFIYSRIVQDTVVESIKHVDGGSSAFSLFALKNMKENEDTVLNVLIDSYKVDKTIATKFIEIGMNANSMDIPKVLCRLPSGASSGNMAKMVKCLQNMDNVCNGMSYYKIMKNFMHDLSNGSIESNEIPEDNFIENIIDY